MNKTKLRNCDIDSLVAEYVHAAIEYGGAVRNGDSRRTNKAYDHGVAIDKELQRRGKESVLLALLDHDDVAVRYWAASSTLNLSEDAERVLTSIANSDEIGPISGMAEATLDVWKSGGWEP